MLYSESKDLNLEVLERGNAEGSNMKKNLIDILCCPVCKGELEIIIKREDEEEILEGTLRCGKCNYDFPIEDGIPNLLPPEE